MPDEIISFFDRDAVVVSSSSKNIIYFADNLLILGGKSVAAVEHCLYCLVIGTHFVFVLDEYQRYIQEAQPCDMGLGKQSIF